MKKEERTALSKEKILLAAVHEFGENGYKGATLNKICDAGIPKGLLYHNYENKDAVYIACVQKCYSDLLNALDKIDESGDLESYMAVRMKFFSGNPLEANIIFDSMYNAQGAPQAELKALKNKLDTFNMKYFKRILSKVTLRKTVSEQDAADYFFLMQSMFNFYFSGEECGSLSPSERVKKHEEALPKLLDFILYGIAEGKDK